VRPRLDCWFCPGSYKLVHSCPWPSLRRQRASKQADSDGVMVCSHSISNKDTLLEVALRIVSQRPIEHSSLGQWCGQARSLCASPMRQLRCRRALTYSRQTAEKQYQLLLHSRYTLVKRDRRITARATRWQLHPASEPHDRCKVNRQSGIPRQQMARVGNTPGRSVAFLAAELSLPRMKTGAMHQPWTAS
jgi:hypothetical protein